MADHRVPGSDEPPTDNDDWISRLSEPGQTGDEAVAQLRQLMLRAARHRISRMPQADDLGPARRDEIVHSAANEATEAILSRLHTFEGRSRFTTWAYKFAVMHAGVAVRRSVWRGRVIHLREVPEPSAPAASSPETHAEGLELADAVRRAMHAELTAYQRRVAVALLIDEIPIDVLSDRLGS